MTREPTATTNLQTPDLGQEHRECGGVQHVLPYRKLIKGKNEMQNNSNEQNEQPYVCSKQ